MRECSNGQRSLWGFRSIYRRRYLLMELRCLFVFPLLETGCIMAVKRADISSTTPNSLLIGSITRAEPVQHMHMTIRGTPRLAQIKHANPEPTTCQNHCCVTILISQRIGISTTRRLADATRARRIISESRVHTGERFFHPYLVTWSPIRHWQDWKERQEPVPNNARVANHSQARKTSRGHV